MSYTMEYNCKHNRNPSVKNLIDHTQLQIKTA